MDIWDTYLLENDNETTIKNIIDQHGLIMFFKKDNEYFGCGEDGRIVFAKMKNPDDDMPESWEDDASFTATNLSKMVKGEPSQQVFNKKSMKNLKVVDGDKVVEQLKNDATDAGKKLSSIKIIQMPIAKDRDQAPNFNRTDEE
jgi:hypothetical protein